MTTQKLNKLLIDLAERDPLTGAFNRRAFYNTSELLIANAKSDKKHIAIVLFDFDQFKQINDQHSHIMGDKILKLFVETANSNLRSGDLFVRFGGDEFLALLINDDPKDSLAIVERISSSFSESSLALTEIGVKSTLSAGINYLEEDDVDINGAIYKADKALYQAKDKGRNCFVVYD